MLKIYNISQNQFQQRETKDRHIRIHVILLPFLPRELCSSAVLGVVILSVRPSVRPSHACFVTDPKNLPATFYTT